MDPTTVDLSFVEPALRADVLHRITMLERSVSSPGRNAERGACRSLGISRTQPFTLTRAWTARRRAEDITLRATKRRRMSNLQPAILDLIAQVCDEMPGATAREIEVEIARRAMVASLAKPSYPTVIKYLRERSMAGAAAAIAAIDADIIVDVVVCDMPVVAGGDAGLRPHLVLAFAREGQGWPAALGLTGGAADVAAVAATLLAGIAHPASVSGPKILTISLLAGRPGNDASHTLGGSALELRPRTGELGSFGRIAAMIVGGSIAGCRLRPGLVGRPSAARTSARSEQAAADPLAAASYLLSMAREGRHPPTTSVSPLAALRGTSVEAALKALARHRDGQERQVSAVA